MHQDRGPCFSGVAGVFSNIIAVNFAYHLLARIELTNETLSRMYLRIS